MQVLQQISLEEVNTPDKADLLQHLHGKMSMASLLGGCAGLFFKGEPDCQDTPVTLRLECRRGQDGSDLLYIPIQTETLEHVLADI